MNFNALIQKVINSAPEQWYRVLCWDGGTGPSYKKESEFSELDQGKPSMLKADSCPSYAIYKENVFFSLMWGMSCNEDFSMPWITRFSDTEASSHFVDLFYDDTIVHRDVYISVDGGSAFLPLPPTDQSLSVSRDYAALIRLINNLGMHTSKFDDYFARADLSLNDSAWPVSD